MVKRALQLGYRHIDTATLYNNEAEVGKAIRQSGIERSKVFVTTKLWNNSHGRQLTISACNRSLQLLGLDYIDLYLIHSPLSGQLVETYSTLVDLKEQGKVRSIGVSNFGVEQLTKLIETGLPPPAVNQIEVHTFCQRPELVEYCKAQGIVVQCYSPLAKARYKNHTTLSRISRQYNKTWAQLMLRWCVQQDLAVVVKSSSSENQRKNINVFDFRIEQRDWKRIEQLDKDETTGWDPTMAPWYG